VLAKVQHGLDEKGSEVNIEKNMIEMAKLERPEDDATVESDVLEVTKKVVGSPAALKEVANSAGLSEEVFKEAMVLLSVVVKEASRRSRSRCGGAEGDLMAFVHVAPRSHTPGRCAPPGAKLVPALVPCYFLLIRGVIRSVFGTRTGPPTNCISSVPPPQAGAGEEAVPVGVHSSAFPSPPSVQGAWWYHRTPTDRPHPWDQPTGSVR
jgi:hypothetical protein